MKMQHSILIFSISTFFPFPPQITQITQIKRKYNAVLISLFNPSRGCGVVPLLPPRVSPAVIDIQALRACLCNSEIFVLNLSGSHAGLPLPTYLPGSYQSGISDVACPSAIAQGPVSSSHFPTLSPSFIRSSLSVLNSSLFSGPLVLWSYSPPLYLVYQVFPILPVPVNIPQCFDKNPLK